MSKRTLSIVYQMVRMTGTVTSGRNKVPPSGFIFPKTIHLNFEIPEVTRTTTKGPQKRPPTDKELGVEKNSKRFGGISLGDFSDLD